MVGSNLCNLTMYFIVLFEILFEFKLLLVVSSS